MKQYIGILVMLLGALLQLFTYFSDQVESANIFLGTGLVLVIVGYLLHIFLSKKNATKADVVALVKRTYSEDIENCSFVLNNDYEITKSVSNDGKVTFKVNFSVDQHIQRSSEGKTFGSYTANATLTGDLKISSLTMKEVSRQNQ